MPVGTLVFDAERGETIADLATPGQRVLVAKVRTRGGRAGIKILRSRGHQATAGTVRMGFCRRREALAAGSCGFAGRCGIGGLSERGEVDADFRDIGGAAEDCELSVYDAGAEPRRGERGRGRRQRGARNWANRMVVADLPGSIEGAHEGAGLGIRFLRHVERTRLLVHLIDTSDASEADPIHSFEVISGELRAFSDSLAEKPMIVVAAKLDATTDRTRLEALREFCREQGLEFHAISAATGEGVRELVRSIADALDKIPKAMPEPAWPRCSVPQTRKHGRYEHRAPGEFMRRCRS